jgi:predicted RecB family nuclease
MLKNIPYAMMDLYSMRESKREIYFIPFVAADEKVRKEIEEYAGTDYAATIIPIDGRKWILLTKK